MRIRVVGLMLLVLWASLGLRAQNPADEAAVRKLPQQNCDGWNNRDAHAMAAIMADGSPAPIVASALSRSSVLATWVR